MFKPAVTLILSAGLIISASKAIAQAPSQLKSDPVQLIDKLPNEEVPDIAPPPLVSVLRMNFLKTNEDSKEYELNQMMVDYRDAARPPSLRLNRMWSGKNGILLEIEGLPIKGRSASAIIRRETFVLTNGKATAHARQVEGITIQQDPKGGSALIIRPGEKMLVEFESINDFYPLKLQHTAANIEPFTYFENIDPRFRERYDLDFQGAMEKNATPEVMKDFLVDFSKNDPDKRTLKVFLKLINTMRAQQTFEGYYNAYLLIQDPEDAKKAMRLASTEEQQRKVENMAVASLASKSRLFDFDFSLTPSQSQSREGSCWMLCTYNMKATRSVAGVVSLRPNPSSPIKLKVGTYKVTLEASVHLPRHGTRKSNWLGNFDGRKDENISSQIVLTVKPPQYSVQIPVDIAQLTIAFLERGSMGGIEGAWAIDDATMKLTIKNVELIP
jgi:hypothetical protein